MRFDSQILRKNLIMEMELINKYEQIPTVEGELQTMAYPVQSQTNKVLIPAGLQPGDTFIYTSENDREVTVVVPPNAREGMYLNIVIPDEVVVDEGENDKASINISKATAGAAILGGIVGAVAFGPIGCVVLAGGAAYATTRKKGKVGRTTRRVGKKVFSGMEAATTWVNKKVSKAI